MYRIKINYVYLHQFIRRKLIYKEDLYILIQKKTYIKRLIIAKILKYEIILSCFSTHDTVYFLLVPKDSDTWTIVNIIL